MATSMGSGASVVSQPSHAWQLAAVALALAFLVALVPNERVSAQGDERVSGGTEKLHVDRVHIGHDCGEVASVLIAGNVVIQRPWSRVNRASRAERIRARRETGGAAPTTLAPAPNATASQDCHPAYGRCLPNLPGDALNCDDIGNQQLEVFDKGVDPYNLDAINERGNGVTCDDIG
jgi:hypothetical protein